MSDKKSISTFRREFGASRLSVDATPDHPYDLFEKWFSAILEDNTGDPTACVLATVDENNLPDARVVLLKDVSLDGFVFYTNYTSRKAQQLEMHPYAALTFYWPGPIRQVRIRGAVKKIHSEISRNYFHTRPRDSQLSVYASRQSQITTREKLDDAFAYYQQYFKKKNVIPYPEFWGGYIISPTEYEFWQGRDYRLHDRIQYNYEDKRWLKHVLAP